MSEKRQISVAEKRGLARTDQNALILLGPGCPEVDELKFVGFKEEKIFGIDRQAINCVEAREQYPKMTVICTEFAKFWQTKGCRYQWGYIHLDFCGQARPTMIAQAIETLDNIVIRGRLRVTFSGSLARLNRTKEEAFLLEQVVGEINIASAGRSRLINSLYYTSSLSHRETYLTAWWDKVI